MANETRSKLKRLLSQADNRVCADCGAQDPKWALSLPSEPKEDGPMPGGSVHQIALGEENIYSKIGGLNLGLSYINCSDMWSKDFPRKARFHHLRPERQVVSVTLDEWSEDQVEIMEAIGGNAAANAVYEDCLPPGTKKPSLDASVEERTDYIRRKYEDQEFLKPTLRIKSATRSRSSPRMEVKIDPPLPTMNNSASMGRNHRSISSNQRSDTPTGSSSRNRSFMASSRKSGASLSRSSTSSSSPSTAGMVEFLGLLKVRIVRGITLAVRDLLSSDPYVVVTLGSQTSKTRVINRNLNPVWDEELMLSVPSPPQPLKLQVFDKDVFSADDIMGEAEIDLNPLIMSAQMHQGMFEEYGCEQIGRWLATSDNALLKDSNIEVIDGLIKQDVHLKLQNVERGELQISLEWVPLAQ